MNKIIAPLTRITRTRIRPSQVTRRSLHSLINPNCLEAYRWRRCLATQAGRGAWKALSASERAAWTALQYTEDSWEGRRPPPTWKEWNELNLEEQAAAIHGLGVKTAREWKSLAPNKNDIPSLASLMDGTYDSDDKTSSASVALETRAIRQQKASSLVQMALNTAKGLAPVVGPFIRSAASGGRGNQAIGLTVVGSLLESIPSLMDSYSGVLEITGVDTVLYLDDSCSMQEGSNLQEARKALQSLESRLKTDKEDRFLPTRIVKFGDTATVLNPSEEDWNVSLVSMAWDGSSGGTYMWKMIQDDIQGKYRPAGGKLRVVVITDGADNLSPAPYSGVRGFNPLMKTLTRAGFDIEWHIIVVGNHGRNKEISNRDQNLYESLCRATGGQFLSLGVSGWDEDNRFVARFLDSVEDSGYEYSKDDRRKRQEQYMLEARKGQAEKFDWLQLPSRDDYNKKN